MRQGCATYCESSCRRASVAGVWAKSAIYCVPASSEPKIEVKRRVYATYCVLAGAGLRRGKEQGAIVDKKQVGRVIVAARRREGLDQQTLADLSEISARTLSDLERGTGNPTLSSLLKVVGTLGLEVVVR